MKAVETVSCNLFVSSCRGHWILYVLGMTVAEECPLEGLVEERTLRITLFEWWAVIAALFVDGTDLLP